MYYVIDITDRWGVDSFILLVCTSEEVTKNIIKQYRDVKGTKLSSFTEEIGHLAKELKITTNELHTYLKDGWEIYYQKVNGY